jgi:hypothetical protein
MRQHIARGLADRIVAAAVVAIVTFSSCAARAPMPFDAGFPSDLINTPVCAGSLDGAREIAPNVMVITPPAAPPCEGRLAPPGHAPPSLAAVQTAARKGGIFFPC